MRGSTVALALLLALSGCAHEVLLLTAAPPEIGELDPPLPVTLAVQLGPFADTRLRGASVVERFAHALRDARLAQGVLFPVPTGVRPSFELVLAGSDSAEEPNSNFWGAALASALPPLALFVHLRNDYTLELEALLVRRGEVIGTYRGRATIRHRYQVYAPRAEVEAEGVEAAVGSATRQILAALALDAPRLNVELR
ncbi:MAG: hypothetical protein ACE5IL_16315 [Myxococcota bacterium]